MRASLLVPRIGRRGIISGPRFTPIVQGLPSIVPFVAPEEQERVRGSKFAVRLGANENTFGASPRAVAAMSEAVTGCWMYGDPKSYDLRNALAEYHGLEPLNMVVGEGIDGLLAYTCQLLVGPGDAVVTTHGTYPTLNYFVAGRGGKLHTVPYGADDRHDVDALLAKAAEVDAKIVYLVNPDNPSGTALPASKIEAMIERMPAGALLLLDEAYLELAAPGQTPTVAADDLRCVRLRTFSKGYGLAGMRIGYAIGAGEIISAYDKIRNHFGINRVSQAGALAALQDQAYLAELQRKIAASREELNSIAQESGLVPLPSSTNFVTIDCGRDAAFAKAVLAELLERDVFCRMPGAPPLDRCIRISCGMPEENALVRKALPLAVEAAARRLDAPE
jgi:histidinol-phosphate aminotransferase